MNRSQAPWLPAVWSGFRGPSSPAMTSRHRIPTILKVVRLLVVLALVAVGAVWFGERFLPPQGGTEAGAIWLQGQSPWAPDYGRCRQCGGVLVPRVDELSACRHCEGCKVSYRYQSLPKTIREQERVWKYSLT